MELSAQQSRSGPPVASAVAAVPPIVAAVLAPVTAVIAAIFAPVMTPYGSK